MTIQRKRVAKRLASGLLAGALALGGLAISGASTVSAKTPTTSRISGVDRYDTAVNIAIELGNGFSTVYLASGENYADALAAAGLAGDAAPILLTATGSLPAVVTDYLSNTSNVDADANVIIVGGQAAVSTAVESQLEEISSEYTITREEGASRYATAVEVAKAIGSSPTDIIVVSGTSPWDAMIASALSAERGIPILYSGPSGLDEGTVDYIEAEVADSLTGAFIVGGPAAVPTSVYEQLAQAGIAPASLTLLFGANRYETSAAVNTELLSDFGGTDLALVRGDNWPDSLSSAPYLASDNRHAALVLPTSIPEATAGLLGVLVETDPGTPVSMVAIGGTSAVSSAVLTAAKSASAELADQVGVVSVAEGADSFTVSFLNVNLTATVAFDTHLEDESKYTVNGLPLTVFENTTAAAATAAVADADLDGSLDDTVVTVTLPTGYPELVAGDVIALKALAESGNDHAIVAVSATVADDNSAPTLTAIHKTAGSSFLFLASEELVGFTNADVSVTRAAGACTGVVVVAVNAPAYVIGCDNDGDPTNGFGEALAEDDVITFALDGFSDVAGNDGGAAGAELDVVVTAADATGPKAQAASITYEADGQVGFSIPSTTANSIDLVAVAGGIADGFAGNMWRIVLQNSSALVPSWDVDATTMRATLTANFLEATAADILWALENDAEASAVFEDDSTTGGTQKVSTAFLSGDVVIPASAGTSKATITITFDEAVYEEAAGSLALTTGAGATAWANEAVDVNTLTATLAGQAAPITSGLAIAITDVDDWTGNDASINSIETP